MERRPAHQSTPYRWDLTPRQREVLDLIARGRTNGEIAAELGISLDGAKYHVREILGKLGAGSREEAVVLWRERQRPLARLGRAFSAWFGGAGAKWALGAAGVATIGVGFVVLAVVLASSGSSGTDEPSAGTLPWEQSLSATPTIAIPSDDSRDAALRKLEAEDPRLLNVVEAIEAQDLDAVVKLYERRIEPCSPDGLRGYRVPPCSLLGLAQGTNVEVFSVYFGTFVTEESVRSLLTENWLLDPNLALVAQQEDGSIQLLFTVSPAPDFPGQTGLEVWVKAGSDTPIAHITDRGFGAAPLYELREMERNQSTTFEILYISPEAREWEAAAQAERLGGPPPGHDD